MVTFSENLNEICQWSIDRMHFLCEDFTCDNVENAFAIQQEFAEWLNTGTPDHDVISLEYISDED